MLPVFILCLCIEGILQKIVVFRFFEIPAEEDEFAPDDLDDVGIQFFRDQIRDLAGGKLRSFQNFSFYKLSRCQGIVSLFYDIVRKIPFADVKDRIERRGDASQICSLLAV